MEWIKRRGDDDDGDEAEDKPVKRRWEKTGLTWLKRRNTPTSRNQDGTRLAEERRDAADNWDSGFVDIDWIKRHPSLDNVDPNSVNHKD